jgi:hypothetical protein
MSQKFEAFRQELIALCIKHQVTLGSTLYDSPAVFDMGADQEPIHQDCLEDCTSEAAGEKVSPTSLARG